MMDTDGIASARVAFRVRHVSGSEADPFAFTTPNHLETATTMG